MSEISIYILIGMFFGRKRIIGGIPFFLYKIIKKRRTAEYIANSIRRKGYYVRVIHSRKGYEIWVSENPKWFFKWF